MSWIGDFLDQTSDYEAPSQYYYWSGLAAISAAAKDHLWIKRASERFKTYPNIYVMLLARTGITRKSHPISLAEQLVSEAKITRVISGRSSIEKIVDDLGTAGTTENGQIHKDSCAFIISSELTSSLIQSSQTLTILTDLFDRNYRTSPWRVNLKSGVKTLKNPTVTFLTATNDEHMKHFFESKDMYGGFLGRTLIINADVPKRLNALLRDSDKFPDIKALSGYLREIEKLEGQFELSDAVITEYEKWYEGFYGPVQRGEADVIDKTGTFPRIGDHVLKISMLLSLSEGLDKVINMKHLHEAIAICEPFVEISQRAVRGIGKSSLAQQTAMVMEFLEKKNGFATRVQILQAFTGDIDHADLNHIQTHLEESGFIVIERYGTGQAYQVPSKVMEKYKTWKASRKGGDS